MYYLGLQGDSGYYAGYSQRKSAYGSQENDSGDSSDSSDSNKEDFIRAVRAMGNTFGSPQKAHHKETIARNISIRSSPLNANTNTCEENKGETDDK